jgi:hypothetical protein
MTAQSAPAINPERMFLRASLRSIGAKGYSFTSATIAPNSSAR